MTLDLLSSESWGRLAAVATSFLWATTSLAFTAGGKRIGATVVNFSRLVLAAGFLAIAHRWSFGVWAPTLTTDQWVSLGLSGLLGLAICDQCLFIAFVEIGPRRSQLVMTTSPLFAAAFGALFLSETLPASSLVGVLLTLSGVAWVITERAPARPGAFQPSPAVYRRGLLLSLVGAVCQAGGLWLAKRGMGHGTGEAGEHLPALSATLVRMEFGVLGMAPVFLAWLVRQRRSSADRPPRRWRSGLSFAAVGAIGGPFLGVWLSLEAAERVQIGEAQTLCSLSPVMILLFVGPVYGEKLTARAIGGAVLAVVGAAVLFR